MPNIFFFCLNSGAEAWPPGVCLKYVGGDQFGHVNMVMVRSLEPQEIADVSVQMCSPSRAGMYQGQWRMCTATGLYYGGEYVPVQPRGEAVKVTAQLPQHCSQLVKLRSRVWSLFQPHAVNDLNLMIN